MDRSQDTSCASSRGRAGKDAARLGVTTSVLFVMQEVGSSVSERSSHQPGSPSLRPSHPWASVTSPLPGLLTLLFAPAFQPLLLGLPLLILPHTFTFRRILGRPGRSLQFLEGQGRHPVLEKWSQRWQGRSRGHAGLKRKASVGHPAGLACLMLASLHVGSVGTGGSRASGGVSHNAAEKRREAA